MLSSRDSQEALGELTAERKAQIQKEDSARLVCEVLYRNSLFFRCKKKFVWENYTNFFCTKISYYEKIEP